MEKLTTLEILDRVSFIQDGINAARVVALASENILSEDDRDNALEWVFDKINDSTNELRAELTAIYAVEKEAAQ